MAARTLTYTINMSGLPKATHIGPNTIAFDFNSGGTKLGTLSDMVLLGKIPNGALFTDGEIRFGIQASGTSTWTMLMLVQDALGTYSTYASLPSTGSITAGAAVGQYRFCVPQKVSLSDDRAIQFVTLALNCTVGLTETVSFSFQGYMHYVTDGSNV